VVGGHSIPLLSKLTGRQKRLAAFLLLVIVGMSYLLYAVAIPRTELRTTTIFHESFSGISIGIEVKNSGTLDVSGLTVNATVTDSDGKVRHSENIEFGGLKRGAKASHSFTFSAPQAEPYNITLRFIFSSDGRDYNETLNYHVEDYMNFIWKDKIRDWRA